MTNEYKVPPKPWRIVKAGEGVVSVMHEKSYTSKAEDDCIVDANGIEVIGCSEWMRGSENFQYIIDCVNNTKD